MEKDSFYILESGEHILFSPKWAYAGFVEPLFTGACIFCPSCKNAVSQLSWLSPRKAYLSSSNPKKWGDLAWGTGFRFLISDRFLSIYTDQVFSGFTFISEPVEIIRIGKKDIFGTEIRVPPYRYVEIKWGAANQDDIASEVRYINPQDVFCDYCRQGDPDAKQNGVYMESGSWDGSDIFIPR